MRAWPATWPVSRELAERHGLAVIEDAAHGLFADLDGRPLGSFGDAGCFSFDRLKNVTCGEGGALAVNREDWVARAEVMVDRGTNRRAFERGEVPAYSWVDLGASSVPGELVGGLSVGAARGRRPDRVRAARDLERVPRAARRRGGRRHAAASRRAGGQEPGRPHLLRAASGPRERDRAIARLDEAEVTAAFHFVPLHSSAAGLRYGRAAGALDVTDDVAARLVRLPIWPGLSEADVERVVRVLVDAPRPRAGAARA